VTIPSGDATGRTLETERSEPEFGWNITWWLDHAGSSESAEDYCEELIGERGFPPTEINLAIGWATICQQFAIKAVQFIASKDRRAADRFVESHGKEYPGHSDAQQILNDLEDIPEPPGPGCVEG
jgi:hypothetical protein